VGDPWAGRDPWEDPWGVSPLVDPYGGSLGGISWGNPPGVVPVDQKTNFQCIQVPIHLCDGPRIPTRPYPVRTYRRLLPSYHLPYKTLALQTL
jgi:hypothetical protein